MSKVLAIMWREFKYTALTKTFIIGTIVFPLIIWGGMFLVPLLITQVIPPVEGKFAIVDAAGDVAKAAAVEFAREAERSKDSVNTSILENPEAALEAGAFATIVRLNVRLETYHDEAEFDRLREAAREGELLGVALVSPLALDANRARREPAMTLVLQTGLNPDHADAIRRTLGNAVIRARVAQSLPGIDPEDMRAMLRQPTIEVRRLTAAGEAAGGFQLQRLLPIAFMFLLWIAAFASGNYLLTTTIEEKSNKVMEVLLSAVSPWQLMAGKIFGQAIVGLFTISVYGMLGFGALWYFAMHDLIAPIQIVYLAIFFFMAYFMFAAMMAAVGSAVSDIQEANALIMPAMIVLFIPMVLFLPVSQSPNGHLATVTSFIPPFTPFVMIIRVTSPEEVPLWHIVGAICAGSFGVLLMIWMAARVFRVGVLMYGKPPSPLELVRWIRYS